MRRCILTIGISASGKTTWAEEYVENMIRLEKEYWVNLNRDDIRHEVFEQKTGRMNFSWSQWNRKWEKLVTAEWKKRIEHICQDYTIKGVVISDTNLNPTTREFLTNRFESAGFKVVLQHFPIDYETAVKRDLSRINPVGSAVIAEQIQKYWAQFGDRYTPDITRPQAVIFDVDGTLAHVNGKRNIFDFDNIHLDDPDHLVMNIARALTSHYHIIIVSGRDDCCKAKTIEWLKTHLGREPSDVFMRVTGDTRRDCIVKKEIFFRDIAPKYHVIGVFDDRPQVIMGCWAPLGIQVLKAGLHNPYVWF